MNATETNDTEINEIMQTLMNEGTKGRSLGGLRK